MNKIHTAVLIDLENLIEGYTKPGKHIQGLSLAGLVEDLNQLDGVEGIAVLRAYANWSDSRLRPFREEVNRIGIEPVQVFGLGRNGAKNVADIQLAVDAIDLAHIRPNLDTYIIVSGDGGFSAVAKKLREYGKTVIGASYRSCASRVLPALCDAFHWIPRPGEAEAEGSDEAASPEPTRTQTEASPRTAGPLIAPLEPGWRADEGVDKLRELLHAFATTHADALRAGVHMNILREAIVAVLPGFTPARFDTVKFTDLLANACTTTPLAVFRQRDGVALLGARTNPPPKTHIMVPEPPPEDHSEAHYRKILETGKPYLRFPPARVLHAVIAELCDIPPEDAPLEGLAEQIATDTRLTGELKHVRDTLRLLVFTEVLDQTSTAGPLEHRTLRLGAFATCPRAIRDQLYAAAFDKVSQRVSDVRVETLRALVGDAEGGIERADCALIAEGVPASRRDATEVTA